MRKCYLPYQIAIENKSGDHRTTATRRIASITGCWHVAAVVCALSALVVADRGADRRRADRTLNISDQVHKFYQV
jgi:hypothetical protein